MNVQVSSFKIKYMCTFDAPLLKSSAKLKVVRKGDKLKRKKKANKSKKKTEDAFFADQNKLETDDKKSTEDNFFKWTR